MDGQRDRFDVLAAEIVANDLVVADENHAVDVVAAAIRAEAARSADEIERLRKLCLNFGGENAAMRAALSDATSITYPPHVDDAIHRVTIAAASR